MVRFLSLAVVIILQTVQSVAQQTDSFGIRLENYNYPYTVHYMPYEVQHQKVEIGYMDTQPQDGNEKTVVLFHGKNFPAAYWHNTINALNKAGYRVIAPDALGFGKSSKPLIQYSFSLLAAITKSLLDTLGIDKVAVVGHSMGGMLATRFALSYPNRVTALVLEDALGLEDWRSKGVPYRKVHDWYADEKKATYESIRQYHKNSYYPAWKERYDEWVKVQAGFTKSKNHDQYAWVSALTYDMIFTQPVVHEFKNIKVPTLVVVGSEDKTKIARNASEEVARQLGNYKALGKLTAKTIPDATLIVYEGVGHVPHLEIPERYHQDLIRFLKAH